MVGPDLESLPGGEGGADLLKTAAVQPVEPPVNHQIEQRKENRDAPHDDANSQHRRRRLHRVGNETDAGESRAGDEAAQRSGELHHEGLGREEDTFIPGAELEFAVIDHVGEHHREDSEREADAEVDHRAGEEDAPPAQRLLRREAREQQHEEPRHREDAGGGEHRFPAEFRGEEGVAEESGQLGEPGRQQIAGDQILHADRVLEVEHCKSVGKLEGEVEEQREHQHDDHLIVFPQNAEHLPDRGALPLHLPVGDLFPNEEEGDQRTEEEDSGDDGAEPGEAERPAAGPEMVHQRQPEVADQHPRRAGEDAGNHRDGVALLLVVGQRRNHRPVRNVHQRVGDAPEDVGDGDVGELLPGVEPGVEEEEEEHDGVEQRSEEDPRPELPPAGVGVVHDQPHDRIVDGVENARHKKEVADEDRADFADVGEVEHVEGGDDGVDEVLAERADSIGNSGWPG